MGGVALVRAGQFVQQEKGNYRIISTARRPAGIAPVDLDLGLVLWRTGQLAAAIGDLHGGNVHYLQFAFNA